MYLYVKNLSYSMDKKEIFNDIELSIKKGEFVGIIGPNGSGKSTFLKNIYKALKPTKGSIYIDNKNVLEMSNRELANEMAVVAQENSSNFDFKVKDIVLMGRYPKKTMFERSNQIDEKLVSESLLKVGLDNFENRQFNRLSGGEKQRVLIARSIVQETEVLVLDEPTNHLDIGCQIKILNLLKSANKTVFAALHDLNIAAKYCDKIYVIHNGKIKRFGAPIDILDCELIRELYDVDSEIITNKNNTLMINFI